MTAPNPMGCAACGIERRGHGRQYTKTVGWHTWQEPSQGQIKSRMLDRRAERVSMPESSGVCRVCHLELCETCHACRCHRGEDNTCGADSCPAARVRHFGPETKFCVLCLSGEHERVD